MTRKLSILTAVAGLTLVIAAPAAGKGQLAQEEPWQAALQVRSEALNAKHGLGDNIQGTATRSSYEQALQARSEGLNRIHHLGQFSQAPVVTSERSAGAGDARYEEALLLRSQELNRRHELGQFSPRYMDAGERAMHIGATTPAVVPDAFERTVANRDTDGFVKADDFVRLDSTQLPTVVPVATTGDEFEWPQIGTGFVLGLLLIIGIALTLRSRVRPLAH